MILGNVVLAMGSAFFNLSLMGMHPFNSFAMAISGHTGISYGMISIIESSILFVYQIFRGRRTIGAGTFFNWVVLGYIMTFWSGVISGLVPMHDQLICRVIFLVFGVVIMGLGVSMYQAADMGIAPYDALSIILDERTKVPYFWLRFACDGLSAVLTFVAGGIIGVGTLLCVFGLAPFITFFDKLFCTRLKAYLQS